MSPSASTAPLAAQVNVEETVAFAGVKIAVFITGAVLSIPTAFEVTDVPSSTPSFGVTTQATLSPLLKSVPVNVGLLAPLTKEPFTFHAYLKVTLSPSESETDPGVQVRVVDSVAVFGESVTVLNTGLEFVIFTDVELESVPP